MNTVTGDPAVTLIEALAAIEHDQWIEWSRTVAEQGLTPERLARWERYWVPYADLPDDVKEHDRKWARIVLVELPPDWCEHTAENGWISPVEAIEVAATYEAEIADLRRSRWHHNPEAPPEHFCEDCDHRETELARLRPIEAAARTLVKVMDQKPTPAQRRNLAYWEAALRAALEAKR